MPDVPLFPAARPFRGLAGLALVGVLAAGPAAQSREPSLELPTDEPEGWQVLRYRGIAPHEVRFDGGLTMAVEASASPVVYPLARPLDVAALIVEGQVRGGLELPPGVQGSSGFDDYVLRAGVVLAGARRPSLAERLFAPSWVRTLFDLAPEDGGISGIRFFNVAHEPGHVGDRRVHPLNDLLIEEAVTVAGEDGSFRIEGGFDPPERALAVWLNADGDDTGSTFEVRVDRISLAPGARPDSPDR